MAYLSLDIAKRHLNIEPEYTDDDALIEQYIGTAELMVELDIHESLTSLEVEPGKIPAPLIQAMLLLVGTYYVARETIAFGVIKQELPAYDHLVSKYRNYSK